MSIELKTPEEIELMRIANMLVYQVHQELAPLIVPGVTTEALDKRAEEVCRDAGAEPAFLGYPASAPGVGPFTGCICASVNEEIVHGIPGSRELKDGDIISVDFGCKLNDFFGDSAQTYRVGEVSDEAEKLLQVTAESLERAIAQCKPGNRIGDISNAVQSYAEPYGFGIVREFVGHGIGRKMHEPPHVPNFGRPGQGRVLRTGMVLAIEPMITVGSFATKVLADGWTAVTKDGSLSAHFEHTVAITDSGPLVLSRPASGANS